MSKNTPTIDLFFLIWKTGLFQLIQCRPLRFTYEQKNTKCMTKHASDCVHSEVAYIVSHNFQGNHRGGTIHPTRLRSFHWPAARVSGFFLAMGVSWKLRGRDGYWCPKMNTASQTSRHCGVLQWQICCIRVKLDVFAVGYAFRWVCTAVKLKLQTRL
jgi:hypothetical protein